MKEFISRCWENEKVRWIRGWLLSPIIIAFILRDRWNCAHGRHDGCDPNGYCGVCGGKIHRGRGDPVIPEGLLYIWNEVEILKGENELSW
jgi:hypothetical protein